MGLDHYTPQCVELPFVAYCEKVEETLPDSVCQARRWAHVKEFLVLDWLLGSQEVAPDGPPARGTLAAVCSLFSCPTEQEGLQVGVVFDPEVWEMEVEKESRQGPPRLKLELLVSSERSRYSLWNHPASRS